MSDFDIKAALENLCEESYAVEELNQPESLREEAEAPILAEFKRLQDENAVLRQREEDAELIALGLIRGLKRKDAKSPFIMAQSDILRNGDPDKLVACIKIGKSVELIEMPCPQTLPAIVRDALRTIKEKSDE